jgi:hypothetical protein
MSRLPNLDPGRQLSPEDLRLVGEALFGDWGWQTRLAEMLEVDGSTVRRWVSGAVAIPGPVKVALRLMLEARGLAPRMAPPAADTRKLPARPRALKR